MSLLLHLDSPRDPLLLRLDSRKSSMAGVEDVFFEGSNPTSGFYQVTSITAWLRPLFVTVSKETRKTTVCFLPHCIVSLSSWVFFFVLHSVDFTAFIFAFEWVNCVDVLRIDVAECNRMGWNSSSRCSLLCFCFLSDDTVRKKKTTAQLVVFAGVTCLFGTPCPLGLQCANWSDRGSSCRCWLWARWDCAEERGKKNSFMRFTPGRMRLYPTSGTFCLFVCCLLFFFLNKEKA